MPPPGWSPSPPTHATDVAFCRGCDVQPLPPKSLRKQQTNGSLSPPWLRGQLHFLLPLFIPTLLYFGFELIQTVDDVVEHIIAVELLCQELQVF